MLLSPEIKKHIRDLIISAIGAAFTAGMLTFFQYLGAHIPDLAGGCAQIAGAFTSLKASRFHA